MVDTAEPALLYWLAGDGKRVAGTEPDLRAALAARELPATTLVWRSGWAEWLPANCIAEFANFVPDAERVAAREPKRDERRVSPPAPSVERLPAFGARPATSGGVRPAAAPRPAGVSVPAPRSGSATLTPKPSELPPLVANVSKAQRPAKPPPASEAARDTLAPSSFGSLAPPKRTQPPTQRRPSGTPPPPPVRGRSPMPTLSEESDMGSATATLRPPGAVPPPARGVPALPVLEKRPAAMTPIPAFGPPGGSFEPPAAPSLPPPTPFPTATPLAANALPAVAEKPPLAASAGFGASAPSATSTLDSTLDSTRGRQHLPKGAMYFS